MGTTLNYNGNTYHTVIEPDGDGYAWKALTCPEDVFYLPMAEIGSGTCATREEAEQVAHDCIEEYRKEWG